MIVAIFKGLTKGLIVALFSMLAFIIGLAAALKLSVVVAHYLENHMPDSGKWIPFISFGLVFIAVVILVNLGGKLIEKSFEMVMLGWLNKLGGVILFIFIYGMIYSVFLFYAEKVHLFSPAAIEKSATYSLIQPWGPKVINGFGSLVPFFKNMFAQLQDFFDSMSNKMPH